MLKRTKGMFVGGASSICASALQNGDFYIGLGCAVMLIMGGVVINLAPGPKD